jgi:mRNA degradation ribonuclease J1/J2
MKTVIFLLLLGNCLAAAAQNNLTANIIEGGKTLVDLIRVFKTPKATNAANNTITVTDSCSIKNLADITYKNSGTRAVFISLFKRTGAVYSIQPLTLKIAAASRESLYEIPSGIYKFKIEYAEGEVKLLHKEGEIKIQPCDKILKEINPE